MSSPNRRITDYPIRRLVGTQTASLPIWLIHYDEQEDVLWTQPVLFFVIWEVEDLFGQEVQTYSEIMPVGFDKDGLLLEESDNEYVGLSLTPEAKDEEMLQEARRKAKQKRERRNLMSKK